MKATALERLHRLAALWGPSGREHRVAAAIEEMIRPLVDEVRTDRFGNLIAIKRGREGGRRVMLAAHMDTLGAIAMNISDKGYIHLAAVGGLAPQHAIGQRILWGSGAVGVLQHEPVESPKDLDAKKLFCDIGATSREEAEEAVRLGDMCVFTGELQQLGEFIAGPGLDNRAGCAVLLDVAERMGEAGHEVAFVFTAQGEVGPRGAGTAAFDVAPDLAFVVDVTPAGDVPKGPKVDVKLGGGPALKLKDGRFMAHGPLSDLVREVAAEHGIPLQTEIATAPESKTEAQVVSVSGQGVPTAVLDIPGRYLGTGAEMVSLADVQATADLLLRLLQSPLEY